MADLVAGRYRLDRLLGRGAMSQVWQATDLELERRVALKFLAPGADPARFEREGRAAASLSHPNVTRLYDFGWTKERAFMVLECLDESLEDRLRRQAPLPDADSYWIATEIAAGLAHAHAHGVIHRDLKPANVLFDDEGRAKLADFGVARIVAAGGTLTDPGTLVGTSAYMSPEQAAGEPATAASDVYSFGVTLHRMVTGRLPFESASALELVRLHRDEEPPPPSAFRQDIPPHLAAVVAAAMTKDASKRPQDGAALLELLTRTGAGSGATAVTQVIPAAPRRRRRRSLLIALLGALALAGGALAWEVTRSSGTPAPATTHLPPTHHSTSAPAAVAPATTEARTTTTAPTTTRRQTTTTAPTTTVQTSPAHTTTAPTTTAPTTTAATTAPTTSSETTIPTTTASTTTTTTPTTTEPVTTTAPTTTAP